MDDEYKLRMHAETNSRLDAIRERALKKNRQLFESELSAMAAESRYASKALKNLEIAKIALAMLYLGEGTKWKSRRGPLLGSSDPRIITIYIELLQQCYGVNKGSMRCRVQHRSDQDGQSLIKYWGRTTGIPESQFYPCYVDKRTIGKRTKKQAYKGVCAITCPGTHIQLELDIIADIISQSWGISAVG